MVFHYDLVDVIRDHGLSLSVLGVDIVVQIFYNERELLLGLLVEI